MTAGDMYARLLLGAFGVAVTAFALLGARRERRGRAPYHPTTYTNPATARLTRFASIMERRRWRARRTRR